jgi:hypothetical protein
MTSFTVHRSTRLHARTGTVVCNPSGRRRPVGGIICDEGPMIRVTLLVSFQKPVSSIQISRTPSAQRRFALFTLPSRFGRVSGAVPAGHRGRDSRESRQPLHRSKTQEFAHVAFIVRRMAVVANDHTTLGTHEKPFAVRNAWHKSFSQCNTLWNLRSEAGVYLCGIVHRTRTSEWKLVEPLGKSTALPNTKVGQSTGRRQVLLDRGRRKPSPAM